LRLTTGLTNGSRRPVKLITLGSCFLATSGLFLSLTATFCLGRAGLAAAATLVLGATDLLAFVGALVARAGVEDFVLLAVLAGARLVVTGAAAIPLVLG